MEREKLETGLWLLGRINEEDVAITSLESEAFELGDIGYYVRRSSDFVADQIKDLLVSEFKDKKDELEKKLAEL